MFYNIPNATENTMNQFYPVIELSYQHHNTNHKNIRVIDEKICSNKLKVEHYNCSCQKVTDLSTNEVYWFTRDDMKYRLKFVVCYLDVMTQKSN